MEPIHSVSVDLPQDLYDRIRAVAERNQRSVETVLRESLEVLFGAETAELDDLIPRLDTYRDDQLWAVVHQRLAWSQRERLDELTTRGKQGTLTAAEQTELEGLIEQVDRFILLRSHALHLLQQRGHDVDRYFKLGA